MTTCRCPEPFSSTLCLPGPQPSSPRMGHRKDPALALLLPRHPLSFRSQWTELQPSGRSLSLPRLPDLSPSPQTPASIPRLGAWLRLLRRAPHSSSQAACSMGLHPQEPGVPAGAQPFTLWVWPGSRVGAAPQAVIPRQGGRDSRVLKAGCAHRLCPGMSVLSLGTSQESL